MVLSAVHQPAATNTDNPAAAVTSLEQIDIAFDEDQQSVSLNFGAEHQGIVAIDQSNMSIE